MMTDTEKAALRNELGQAMFDHEGFYSDRFEATPADCRSLATACLPIIERVIAERSIDVLEPVGEKPHGIKES